MENTLPHGGFIKGKTHYLPIRIYYADTDFSGIVYHGRYVEFMERGRTEALRAFGLLQKIAAEAAAAAANAAAPVPEPVLFAVSKLNLEFKVPAYIDNLLLVETAIEKLTGARFFIRQRIFRGETLLTDGTCCLALISRTGRPRRIPDNWRALFD
ncbi:MAG: 4-hydroxybenzoyl-CoA thioesterase [Candidatus Tokpelaia sp.]|nr:MAG: 4-hydroxybenzoyl-CoA thioesterase [Candidatus Tokpelaia sp.]KAA6205084.1 MAG: 4-hydroxybenzoyl-CoA thioesterase [Candidatus Tokpelaia sp.]